MAPSREIEKLQRRWQENPLGLTFAPLAEAYRKEGMYEDALELLDIGLTQHPNYIPAHIVRGRCHLDTRSDTAAETAFDRVLDLDPENVIALKSLAEIAERTGRFEDAERHLQRLLTVDRNNDEARAQLDRVRTLVGTSSGAAAESEATRAAEAEALSTVEPEPESASESEPEPAVAAEDQPAPAAEAPDHPEATDREAEPAIESGPAAREPAQPTTEWLEARLEVEAIADELDRYARPAGEVSAPAPEEPPSERSDSGEPEVARADLEAEIEYESAELDVVLFEPIDLEAGGANEFQPPSDAEALRVREERMGMEQPPVQAESTAVPLEEEPAPVEPGLGEPLRAEVEAWSGEAEPGPAEAESELEALEGPDEEPDSEEPVTSDDKSAPAGEPELVVTETMAEVFLRQGHRELALAVYTQLAQREPGNERILEAKRSLEAELRPEAPTAAPVYAATLTGGQSVRAFFEQLLGVPRPDRTSDGPSLGAVFGEDRGAMSEAATEAAEPGPSYDEFFGDEPEAGVPPGPAPTEPHAQPSSEVEDIEEFNSWLRGLKR